MTNTLTPAKVASTMLGEIWITDDGRSMYPQDMSSAHIQNTINFINRGAMKRSKCSGLTQAAWVSIFEAELKRRKAS